MNSGIVIFYQAAIIFLWGNCQLSFSSSGFCFLSASLLCLFSNCCSLSCVVVSSITRVICYVPGKIGCGSGFGSCLGVFCVGWSHLSACLDLTEPCWRWYSFWKESGCGWQHWGRYSPCCENEICWHWCPSAVSWSSDAGTWTENDGSEQSRYGTCSTGGSHVWRTDHQVSSWVPRAWSDSSALSS